MGAPDDTPRRRETFVRNPVAWIILTGLLGGTAFGFIAGAAFGSIAQSLQGVLFLGLVGAIAGLVGGLFATIGALVFHGLARLVTKRYAVDAVATVLGAVAGIAVCTAVFLGPVWAQAWPFVMLAALGAVLGFVLLAILRRPYPADETHDADAADADPLDLLADDEPATPTPAD